MGLAVLDIFSCCISVALISKFGFPLFSKPGMQV